MQQEGDPWLLFNKLHDLRSRSKTQMFPEADFMTVSTAGKDEDGRIVPNSRLVELLEASEDQGFVFTSSIESEKGKELQENPSASLLFFYCFENNNNGGGEFLKIVSASKSKNYEPIPAPMLLTVQIRVKGTVLISSDEKELRRRFDELPRACQVGLLATNARQSMPIQDEDEYEARCGSLVREFLLPSESDRAIDSPPTSMSTSFGNVEERRNLLRAERSLENVPAVPLPSSWKAFHVHPIEFIFYFGGDPRYFNDIYRFSSHIQQDGGRRGWKIEKIVP